MMMLHFFSFFVLGLTSLQPSSPSGLGTVSFPTSCSSAAQPHIERGVALLHSFQYEEAGQEFEVGATRDTSCAMCHWGEAMTRFHPLSGEWPTAAIFDTARGDIIRAQRTGSPTFRERGYIAAIAAFFDASPSPDRRGRLRAYARQFERLHRQFPDDGEAAAFYALSLVTLAKEGVDDLANRRRAINMLHPLVRQQPNHPGAAHYLIHAADTPELAPRGLEAARRYANIAPDSSHALHMPSHIFVRLGLWDETIANLRAAAAGAMAMAEHHGSSDYEMHALDYLAYAYVQRGQEAMARQAAALNNVTGANPNVQANMRAYLAARTALDLHHWDEATVVDIPSGTFRAIQVWWARTIGAARLRDTE